MSDQVQITFAIKNLFFDRPVIQKALRRANRENLGKAAAFVRRVARNSLRKQPKKGRKIGEMQRDATGKFLKKKVSFVSAAGRPPYRRSDPGLQTILYAFDTRAESAIVGPVLLNSSKRLTGKTVPEVHEHGGTASLKIFTKEYQNGMLRSRTKTVKARYPKRPFMAPALEKTKAKFADIWKGSVRP